MPRAAVICRVWCAAGCPGRFAGWRGIPVLRVLHGSTGSSTHDHPSHAISHRDVGSPLPLLSDISVWNVYHAC